ncbi:hypothetical protein DV515_00009587 [Chloebia gouldiae]|uniref:Major facilitator superfamily (MFS) profile domain-containing protein n=1 Tax=Chloebia gouldiae TaxID=44316 RepID=A0A3L8SBP7_CHLGU|nr:hypothetical protein DV515_00009587 [Chloebia gouldiae]
MPAPAEAGRAPGAPDGGWGWVVVFGAFVSIGFAYAFPKGLAIFFKEIQDFFGTSYSEIAWVSSIMLATTYGAALHLAAPRVAHRDLDGELEPLGVQLMANELVLEQVAAVANFKFQVGGPISSILVNRYGSRPVVMFGGLLCGVGMISAAFCTSILQLYICVGFITALRKRNGVCKLSTWTDASLDVLSSCFNTQPLLKSEAEAANFKANCKVTCTAHSTTSVVAEEDDVISCAGFGLALNLQPSVIIIGKYFLRRRPIANGLAMAGSPVMLCTLAPLNQFLFDNFGWRGSFLILGAILLNCCVAGALFRPIGAGTAQVKTQVTEEGKDALKGKITEDGLMENKTEEEGEKDCFEKVNQYLDFSLFKHRGFLIYLIGNVLMFLGFFAPIVFLAPYAKHTGIDEYSAAFLLSILAMVDMVARPTTGIIANSKWVRPRIQYFFSFAIAFNGACHLLCPLASSYSGLIVYSSFFGLAFGMVCAMLFETLMDLVGAARFTSAVGLVTIAECCTILLGPPIGGIIIDTFGDYKYMFIKCGAVMVLAGTFLFIMNYYNYRMLAKEEKERKAKEEDPKYVRTENEGKKTWNKDSTQDGPELEPLREKGEGLKKEMNGTNEV